MDLFGYESGGEPMGWVKVEDSFPIHPKAMAAGPQGRALFLYSLMWSGMQGTNGDVPVGAMPYLAMCLGVPLEQTGDVADKLVEVGLWERTPDGWAVHDWLDWQTAAADRKAAKALSKRRSAAKARSNYSEPSSSYSEAASNYSALSVTCDDGGQPEVEVEREVEITPPLPPPKVGEHTFEAEFNEAWVIYPRKINRKAALRAYVATRRRGVAADTLQTATEGFVGAMEAERREWRLVKHGSTFFGPDEPWQDYLPGGEGLTKAAEGSMIGGAAAARRRVAEREAALG